MSEIFQRKTQPDCMRFIIRFFHYLKGVNSQGTANIEQLVHLLTEKANYAKPTATNTIYNAIHDGLLIPVANSPLGGSQRTRQNDHKVLRLPELSEVQGSDHDFYCYECHLPGILEHCKQCPRSFHRLCYRKDAERPNYTVPSPKLQKNRLPVFSSNTDSSSDEENFGRASTIADYESDVRASSSLQALDQSSSAGLTPQRLDENTVDSALSPIPPNLTPIPNLSPEGKPPILDEYIMSQYDTKTKVEVLCIGEVRPPNRTRPAAALSTSNVSYKSEITPNEDDIDLEKELCTCCRLLKSAAMRNPPNMEPDELCHLLHYTFSRNRSWLDTDIPSYLDTMKLTTKTCNIITKLLFKIPPKRLDTIANLLQNNKYTYLMEFFVDILDLQHNIGVLFGSKSTEMEATTWLVRDITHDLAEIRRCPDCFRYSHEKDSRIWFAKPCVQRHELVFAKHSGFPYWPAKVIRVLPSSKYDVRFFGGNHSRALIDVKYIKPIDSDNRQLKLGNSQALKKAMEELRFHQVLSTYPPSKFSFHAPKEEAENIIRIVLGRGVNVGKSKRGRKRKLTTLSNSEAREETSIIEPTYGDELSHLADKRGRRKSQHATVQVKRITRSADNSIKQPDIKQLKENLDVALKLAETNQKRADKLQSQNQKLKELINKYEIEKKILKRKQWCHWCLNEAIYLCCFKAAYCSEVCQSRHWKDGHSDVCKNPQLQTQSANATSTT